jgi:two-component system, OmpR family, sensor histidine kinase VicK
LTSTLTPSSPIDENIKKELLSDNAIPGEQRIREIEQAVEPEFYDVITDHQKASQILVELAKSVKSEALLLLPRDKSMVRLERLQVFDYIIKASQENNAEVKIMCPLSQINSYIVKRISDYAPNIKILNGNNSPYGMFIVDSHKFFRAELIEPNAEHFSEAIGFTIYSNNKVSANSFKSVFELLWTELILNEELKRADKMQKEFINIAAHELRTPAQSILGYSELASTDPELSKYDIQGFLDAIHRNAIRLYRLTKDILDVTKIESDTLQLNKELVDLNNLIANIVLDFKTQSSYGEKKKVSLTYMAGKTGNMSDSNNNIDRENTIFVVEADKGRITQVISNLLDNAIKFTKEGSISIKVVKAGKYNNHQQEEVMVSVKDTGTGIDSEILPRLFTKFATKSDMAGGTGLGLFISKSIIESHGGRMWAQNNSHNASDNGEIGATFSFTLPLR